MIVNCEQCQEPFERNTPKQKFCSNACKQKRFVHARKENYRLKTIEWEQKLEALQASYQKLQTENDERQANVDELRRIRKENEHLKGENERLEQNHHKDDEQIHFFNVKIKQMDADIGKKESFIRFVRETEPELFVKYEQYKESMFKKIGDQITTRERSRKDKYDWES